MRLRQKKSKAENGGEIREEGEGAETVCRGSAASIL